MPWDFAMVVSSVKVCGNQTVLLNTPSPSPAIFTSAPRICSFATSFPLHRPYRSSAPSMHFAQDFVSGTCSAVPVKLECSAWDFPWLP